MAEGKQQSLVEIRRSPIQGQGLFARVPIARGERVVEYTGERISKSESLRRCEEANSFIFALDENWDLDGSGASNMARFANHSCAPNCEMQPVGGSIWLIAIRDISAGEELTFNYGYDLEDYREYPCHCGAPECVGYIIAEEFFPLLRRRAQA